MNLIEKISKELKLDYTYLSRIAERSAFYYKDYQIKKKDGGTRRVSQPSPELKTLQYWVLQNVLLKLPISNAAYAYKKGDSIKKHALIHKNSRYIFHTDIQSFFPSIHISHLEPILRSNSTVFCELDVDVDDAISDIKKICFRNDSLCIGAVSSPAISNIIMYSFDLAVSGYCKLKKYTYSRYADDIYISSKDFLENDLKDFVSKELAKVGFSMNLKKTCFHSQKNRRQVTGLIITPDSQISIGTERRNEIKKMIYNKLVYNQGDSNQILGYLSFLKDIEPNTYNNFIIKYSQYCDEDIIDALRKDKVSCK